MMRDPEGGLSGPDYGHDDGAARYAALKMAFLNNLEEWINETVARNGHQKDGETARLIQESYKRSLQANIDFYQGMAENADGESAPMRRMAEIYQSLLPAGRQA